MASAHPELDDLAQSLGLGDTVDEALQPDAAPAPTPVALPAPVVTPPPPAATISDPTQDPALSQLAVGLGSTGHPELDNLASSLDTETAHVSTLAHDKTFDPLSYAADAVGDDGTVDKTNPNFGLAKAVNDYRVTNGVDPTAPTLGQKAIGAVKGLGSFAAGAPAAVYNLGKLVQDKFTGDTTDADKRSTIAMVEGQEAEQGLGSMLSFGAKPFNPNEMISSKGPLSRYRSEAQPAYDDWKAKTLAGIQANPNLTPDQKTTAAAHVETTYQGLMDSVATTEQQMRSGFDEDNFAKKVANAKTNAGLATGQVQNTGVLAKAVPAVSQAIAKGISRLGTEEPTEFLDPQQAEKHGITGGSATPESDIATQKASDMFKSPEALASEGSVITPLEKYGMEAAGNTGNPGNILYSFAPQVPLIGSALRGAGKYAAAGADAVTNIVKNTKVGAAAAGALGATGVVAATYAATHGRAQDIVAPVLLGLTLATGKVAGNYLQDVGKMMDGGALAESAGPAYTRAVQAGAGTAGGAAIGALTSDDKAEGAMSGALMGGVGGALGSTRPAMQHASAEAMSDFGSKLKTGDADIDAAHDAQMAKFSPEDQAKINRIRAHLFTSNPVNLVTLDGQSFANVTGAPGQRGAFTSTDPYAVSTDGRTIYLNADQIGGASSMTNAAGHEVGHAVVDYLQRASQSADAASMANVIKSALSPDDIQDIRAQYLDAWRKTNGADPNSSPPNVDPLEENLAEITRKILLGQDVSNFALPKPLAAKISDVAGRALEAIGFKPKASDVDGMTFGTKNVAEAARQMNDALYKQGADARATRAKMGAGANDVGTQLQSVYQRQAVLDATPPGQRPANAPQIRAELQRERDRLEGELQTPQTGKTPPEAPGAPQGSGNPPEPPPAPPGSGGGASPTPPETPPATTYRTLDADGNVIGGTPTAAKPAPDEPYADIGLTQAQVDAVRDSYVAPQGGEPQTIRANSKKGIAGKSADQVADERGAEWDRMFQNYVDYLRKNGMHSPLHPLDIRQNVLHLELMRDAAPSVSPPGEAPLPLGPLAKVRPVKDDSSFKTKIPESKPTGDAPGALEPKPAIPTAEDVTQAADDAEKQARATPEFAKKRTAKTKNDLVQAARTGAILDAVHASAGGDDSLMQRRETPAGTVYRGSLDPDIPAHAALIKEAYGDRAGEVADTIRALKDNSGKTVYLDYKAAKKTSADISGAQRAEEQAANTAGQRRKGAQFTLQQNKAFLPNGFKVFPSGKINASGFSPDKWISNAGKLMNHAKTLGITPGYHSINDPRMITDMRGYAENHANGYLGDGSGPIAGQEPTEGYDPHVIKKDNFDLLNAALNYDQSTKIDSNTPGARESAFSAQEAALENNRPVDEQTGDTNPFRAMVNKEGKFVGRNTDGKIRTGTEDHLESVDENVDPSLILNVKNKAGSQNIVRPVGFSGDPGAALESGKPNSAFAKAGFMPSGEGALSDGEGDTSEDAPKWWNSNKSAEDNLKPVLPDLASVAQKVYDNWDQSDEEYGDPDLGFGGICQDIAEEMAGVLSNKGIDARTIDNEGMGDQRVWVVAKLPDGVYTIDIPPHVYESGGGYTWTKKPGVKFNDSHISIDRIDKDPNKFEQYSGDFMPAGEGALSDSKPSIEFTQPERAKKSGAEVVNVKIPEFDKAFQKDSAYVAPGKEDVKGRRQGVRDFIDKGKFNPKTQTYEKTPMEMPEVFMGDDDSAGFVNGRHRYAVLRDSGHDTMPVSMSPADAEIARNKGIAQDSKFMPSGEGALSDSKQSSSFETKMPEDVHAGFFSGVGRAVASLPDKFDNIPERTVAGREVAARDVPDGNGGTKTIPARKEADKVYPAQSPGDQALAAIKKQSGVTQNELDTLGLPQFLKDNPTASKGDIQNFVKANSPRISEVVKGAGREPVEHPTWEAYDAEGDTVNKFDSEEEAEEWKEEQISKSEEEWQDDMRVREDDDGKFYVKDSGGWNSESFDTEEEAEEELRRAARENAEEGFQGGIRDGDPRIEDEGETDQTKFGEYKSPGGENYQEKLYTLPPKISDQYTVQKSDDGYEIFKNGKFSDRTFSTEYQARDYVDEQNKESSSFHSSHWDEKNPLFHIRQQDFKDTEGNDVRHIEEVQSDWHQKGRKLGYQDNSPIERKTRPSAEIEAELRAIRASEGNKDPNELYETNPRFKELRDEAERSWEEEKEIRDKKESAVPDAPFKKNWHELAMKYALRDAVADGKDKLSWVTGETAADRFDLSKKLDSVTAHPDKDGKINIVARDLNGAIVHHASHTSEELPDVLGKDLANKIVSDIGEQGTPQKETYSGLDLRVGGEGMKGFYDKILPDFMRSYVKPWGGKVETSKLAPGKELSAVSVKEPQYRNSDWIVTMDDGSEVNVVQQDADTKKDAMREAESIAASSAKRGIREVHSVTITPAMRKAIQAGQAMFMPSGGKALEKGASSFQTKRANSRGALEPEDGQDRKNEPSQKRSLPKPIGALQRDEDK